jgi:hypothetical protein
VAVKREAPVLSLFTGSQTILDILFSSNWGFGFPHLLLILSGALLVLAIKYKRKFDHDSSDTPDLAWKMTGACFGVLLAIIHFNDILWFCGLKWRASKTRKSSQREL